MKNLSIKQLLAISTLAIALPFSALSHAEPGKDYGKHDCKRGHDVRHGGKVGMHGVPPHMRALNLTQEQKDKIFAIMHEEAPVKYAQRKQQRENHEAMRLLSQADTFDQAKAQQLTDQLGKLEKDKAMSRLQTQAKITALLTPEQRQKAREFKMNHGKHGMGKVRYQRHQPVAKPTNS